MDPKSMGYSIKNPPTNIIKYAGQPIQISSNYLPFYSPVSKSPIIQYTSSITSKPVMNQEIFKQQQHSITSPKNISSIIQQQQFVKKPQESALLCKLLNNGQGLLTQREPLKSIDLKMNNNGSLSERSLIDKKKFGGIKKEQDSSIADKENKNTLNISKPIKGSPKSYENPENFFVSKGKNLETKKEFSKNFSRQDEVISEENSEKFNLLNQRLEISKNLLHQTRITTESEERKLKDYPKDSPEYQEFMKELKSHRSEIVDLKNETKGLKEKLDFLQTKIIDTDRKKKLDELNELLKTANLENKMIRKKTKNQEIKKKNLTQVNEELVKGMDSKREDLKKNAMKTKIEFKKLFQKTDLSKLIIGVGGVKENHIGKLISARNSKNNDDINEILKRKLSNDLNSDRRKCFFKEDKTFDKVENGEKEKENVTESLNTLKKRLSNFLNNYNSKKKFGEK